MIQQNNIDMGIEIDISIDSNNCISKSVRIIHCRIWDSLGTRQ